MAEKDSQIIENENGYLKEPFQSGLSLKTIAASFFVAVVMLPGTIYLGLMAGQSIGGAAQWVTMILFLEITKRSLVRMSKQEIYMIHNMVSATMSAGVVLGAATLTLPGGIFSSFIWNAYLIESPYAESFGLSKYIPTWAVPPAGSEALAARTFLHRDWLIPGVLLIVHMFLSKGSFFSLSYAIYRYLSDVEKLPFPMAPVAAQGAMALADSSEGKETWRWKFFSSGAIIGMVFAVVYIVIPTVTGTLMTKPFMLLPIPFYDATSQIGGILPTAMVGITFDLANLFVGFVLPIWVVIGMAAGSVLAGVVANPLIYKYTGIFTSWRPGMGAIPTHITTRMDFWIAFSAGMGAVVAFVGIGKMLRVLLKAESKRALRKPPPGRGDIPIWSALLIYIAITATYVWLVHLLVPDFPVWISCVFGFVLSPLFTFVSSLMFGITGVPTGISFPYLRELSIIYSGYRGAGIWFAPLPLHNYGTAAQDYRELELTRTKFSSWLKVTFIALCVSTVFSFIFWHLIWRMGPIPSSMYPYVEKMWPMSATFKCLWATTTLKGGSTWMIEAITKPNFILAGAGTTAILYALLSAFKCPLSFFFGVVAGIDIFPHLVLPMLIGALLARFCLSKKLGGYEVFQRKYAPVLLAGFGCGMGLVGMFSIGMVLISKVVIPLIF